MSDGLTVWTEVTMNAQGTLTAILCLGLALGSQACAQSSDQRRAALRKQLLSAPNSKSKRAILKQMMALSPSRGTAAGGPSQGTKDAKSAAPRLKRAGDGTRGKSGRRRPKRAKGARSKNKRTQGRRGRNRLRGGKRRRRPTRASRAEIKRIEKKYGVELDDNKASEFVRETHRGDRALDKRLRDRVRDRPFTARELELVEEALDLLEPLLGSGDTLDRLSRVNSVIWNDPNMNGGESFTGRTGVQGQHFPEHRTAVLTDEAHRYFSSPAADDIELKFTTPDDMFRSVVVHEVAHAVLGTYDPRTGKRYEQAELNPLVQEFRQAAGWSDRGGRRDEDAEAPPNRYAHTSPSEDLAESAKLFLLKPKAFKEKFKKRAAFLEKVFADAKTFKKRTKGALDGLLDRVYGSDDPFANFDE